MEETNLTYNNLDIKPQRKISRFLLILIVILIFLSALILIYVYLSKNNKISTGNVTTTPSTSTVNSCNIISNQKVVPCKIQLKIDGTKIAGDSVEERKVGISQLFAQQGYAVEATQIYFDKQQNVFYLIVSTPVDKEDEKGAILKQSLGGIVISWNRLSLPEQGE